MNETIIIVEDDPAISDILKIILEKNGYRVHEFVLGQTMLDKQPEKPDLFLLDKQLADIDGLEICRQLKSQPETHHIPVIILSAMPDLQQQVWDAGADAYIEKPFTTKHLLDTISRCIHPAWYGQHTG
jgi:DNA-binding response OmpR family regulator